MRRSFAWRSAPRCWDTENPRYTEQAVKELQARSTTKATTRSPGTSWRRPTRAFTAINADDPSGAAMVDGLDLPVFRFGLTPEATVRAVEHTSALDGIRMTVATPARTRLRSRRR